MVPPEVKTAAKTPAIASAVTDGEVSVTRSRRPKAPMGSSVASATLTESRSSSPRSDDSTVRRTCAGVRDAGQSSSTHRTRWPRIVIWPMSVTVASTSLSPSNSAAATPGRSWPVTITKRR